MNEKPRKSIRRSAADPEEQTLARDEVFGGHFPAELQAELGEKLGLPLSYLTESQWKKLAEISGLPERARLQVNIALQRYWRASLSAVDPTTIEKLSRASGSLDGAIVAMIDVVNEDDKLFRGRLGQVDSDSTQEHRLLKECLGHLIESQKLIDRLWAQLKDRRRAGNPGYGPVAGLVHDLDRLLVSELGVRLTRSKKRIQTGSAKGSTLDFVTAVVQMGHLGITASTIDTVVSKYLANQNALPEKGVD